MPGMLPVAGLQDNQRNIKPSVWDETRLPPPEGFLLKIHDAVTMALHFLRIEQALHRGWFPIQKGLKFPLAPPF